MLTATRTRPAPAPVAIVGAGPYGLSIAAHLRARGIAFRIFGTPMQTWLTKMPDGMFLKSEGFASNLSDPHGSFLLKDHCRHMRVPYADVGVPVALSTFAAYGRAFAARFVPDLDPRDVTKLATASDGFELTLTDGEIVRATRVVVAAGIGAYAWMPAMFEGAPRALVTHSSAHRQLERFRGRRVTVVGSGASAVDLAGLLAEAGAETRLVARAPRLIFHDPPEPRRSAYRRLRSPQSGLGPSLKSFFYSNYPDAFSLLPAGRRAAIVRGALGPSACWFTKTQIAGRVETLVGTTLDGLDAGSGEVRLRVRDASGTARVVASDHLIAGTGYRVDLARLSFVTDDLRARVRTFASSPVLSRGFESSVPGLFFAGIPAALTFGPLLRFAYGAAFAAERIATHLERSARTASQRHEQPAEASRAFSSIG